MLLRVALILSFAGLFAAGVLSLGHVLDLPIPCGGSAGCAAVAHHPSSRLLGVPIAFGGVGAFLAMAGLTANAARSRAARLSLAGTSGLGTLASAALLVHSKTAIGATCAWCVASGAIMALLFAVSLCLQRRGLVLLALRPRILWVLGMVTAAALGSQAGAMVNAANRPPIAAEKLANLTAADLVDPAKTIGPGDAPLTIVMFADLSCPVCRVAHEQLLAYQGRNPRGVRLAFRHLALWDHSAAAAAVTEVAAESGKFWPVVAALFARGGTADRDGYRSLLRAAGMDGVEVERRVGNGEDPAVRRLRRDLALAERLGIHGTPAFVVLVEGERPVSAGLRTLPRLLDAPLVQGLLAEAAIKKPSNAAGD